VTVHRLAGRKAAWDKMLLDRPQVHATNLGRLWPKFMQHRCDRSCLQVNLTRYVNEALH
jgi:hypothetical protein